ncbi:MAG: glycosyltransferase family 2 protein [Actinobacteria bacterium]|nr:glycosyltransferase family 2 protein [Actinomycetota bacterium]
MVKFSIIIPLFNHKHRISTIIEALEKQTYKDFEVHFCDDKSKDGTKEFFKTLKQPSFPYKYHRRKWRHGMVIARNINQGVYKAKGEYCLIVMGDSYLHPLHLEILSHFTNSKTVLCGVRHQIDSKTNMVVDIDYRIKGGLVPNQVAILAVNPYDKITGNGLCIPTKALKKVGGWFKIQGYGGDDNILAAKLYAKGYVFYSIPSAIIYHYHHGFSFPTNKQIKYVKRKIKKICFGS